MEHIEEQELASSAEDENILMDATPSVEERDEETPEVVDEVIPLETEPEWKPDYTFKVKDTQHEFDDFIRPIVNKDNYDKIKDLYSKAYGLDEVKAAREKLEEENKNLSTVRNQFEKQNKSLGYLGSLIKGKDYHTLFNELKIPDQEILSYSLDRVKYQELSPEEKREYDGNIEIRQRQRTLEDQNRYLQSQIESQAVNTRMSEVDNLLRSGQINDIVKDFDTRVGRPGAFREEVVKRGQMAYYSTGKDISVNEAVNEVASLYGRQLPGSDGGGSASSLTSQQYSQGNAPKKVIPNIRSGGASPARKLPTSIADLKKAADSFI